MFKTISKKEDYVDVNEDALIAFVAKSVGVSTNKIEVDFDVALINCGVYGGVIMLTITESISAEKIKFLETATEIFDDDDDVYDYDITTDDRGLTMVVITFNYPIYNPNNDF